MIKSILLSSLLAVSSSFAASGELQTSATKIADTYKDSVVWLTVIAKLNISTDGDAPAQVKASLASQEKEEKSEGIGTIIDSSGLIVTSLASIDKSSMIDGKTVNTSAGAIKIKASSEVKELKVIMPDGTEIPGDLVLKDNDLGLGFIRIRKNSKEAEGVSFNAVDVTNSAAGKLLDDCVAVTRLGENMNREPSVFISEITAITSKPRKFYRVSGDLIGSPVFLADGKLLGLGTVRPPSSQMSSGTINLTPVVLPAADLVKLVEQAKATPELKVPAN